MEKKYRLFKDQLAEFSKTKCIRFVGKHISSFSQVEIPDITENIDLPNNVITDFSGFQITSNVHTIILDDNPLLSFKNFPKSSNILHFSAKNSPLSDFPTFRSMALLSIGRQLLTINGKPVTNNDLQLINPSRLFTLLSQSTPTQENQEDQEKVSNELSSYVRQGFIFSTLPRKISEISSKIEKQKKDTITIQVMRIMTLLGKSADDGKSIIRQILQPPLPKVKAISTKTDERLMRQQDLICYMQGELEKLKKAHDEAQEKIKEKNMCKNLTEADIPVSETVRLAYENMVNESAQLLLQNESIVTDEILPFEENYEGLRNAVIKLLDADPSQTDKELINQLHEECKIINQRDDIDEGY